MNPVSLCAVLFAGFFFLIYKSTTKSIQGNTVMRVLPDQRGQPCKRHRCQSKQWQKAGDLSGQGVCWWGGWGTVPESCMNI